MGELLNVIGLSAGTVLYAMLLAMVVQPARTAGWRGIDPLLLTTAVLGLIWNLSALPAYELAKLGVRGPFPLLIAVGFSALGFLPSVVVHSVLRGQRDHIIGPWRRLLAATAYTVAAAATLLHFRQVALDGPVPSAVGMRLLTYAFVATIVPLAVATRGQPGSRRALWVAALAIFAVSALHLSQLHQGDVSWPVELLGHHASVPLAFAILYQDYPFALSDLFLKRALVLLALVAMAFVGVVLVSAVVPELGRINPRAIGLLVTASVGVALLYPIVRSRVRWFVDAIVLRRPDYRALRATIARQAQEYDDAPALLDMVCDLLAPALSSSAVEPCELPPGRLEEAATRIVFSGDDAAAFGGGSGTLAALVLIPTAEPPRYTLRIGPLGGGRRLLSDEMTTLEAIAVLVARRIDAMRITADRYELEIREQESAKLVSEAELRALRAQINPHFLFNALTTIGYLIQSAPPRALETLMRLTALLRAVLRSDGEFTTLGKELEVVEAYLDIERARFEQRLRVRIDVSPRERKLRVPALVLQPVVENAVKHGIAPQRLGGDVEIAAHVERDGGATPQLILTVRDTGAGATPEALAQGRLSGVGLSNVERRLACQYGANASLSIASRPGQGTTVEIKLPMAVRGEQQEFQQVRS
jgi:two-component system LytT family sensor kinase